MLPKVTIPEQVTTLIRLFEIIEEKQSVLNLEDGNYGEATQIIMDDEGRNP
jgi:hypothetical protein